MLYLVPAASNTFRKSHTETVISLKKQHYLARDKLLIHNQTHTQHYLNPWNISLLEPPQHSPATSLPQPLLPFLLFHTSPTNRLLMQQDCQLSTSLPMSSLPHSLSVCLLAIILSLSLPPFPSSIPVSLITIQQTLQ